MRTLKNENFLTFFQKRVWLKTLTRVEVLRQGMNWLLLAAGYNSLWGNQDLNTARTQRLSGKENHLQGFILDAYYIMRRLGNAASHCFEQVITVSINGIAGQYRNNGGINIFIDELFSHFSDHNNDLLVLK